MNVTSRHNALYLAVITALGLWHSVSLAASTDISDTPLPVTSSVAPNIMFMIDNSGSMGNIVPASPYVSTTTYTTCPSGVTFAGGAATVLDAKNGSTSYLTAVSQADGTVYIGSGSTYERFGTVSGRKCFDSSLYYVVGLNADYPFGGYNYAVSYSSIYQGNYLNWYFSTAADRTLADNFGANGTRKSGVQTRLEIAKTAAKTVLTGLDKVRVGMFTYTTDDGGKLLQIMDDLTTSKRTSMNAAIDGLNAENWTPLAETLADIGKYFTTGYTGNLKLHPSSNPTNSAVSTVLPHDYVNSSGVATPAAPVQQWCQRSFAVLMTDGLPTQDQNISTPLQDYYGYCAANPTNCTGTFGKRTYQLDSAGMITTTPEFYETDSNPSDYLDDVANALYDIDLRPDLTPGTKTTKNNLTTYTIGFADSVLQSSTLLARAAAYGGGLNFTATDAPSLVTAFQQASDDILAKDGSAASVAVANAHVTNTDNASYATSYNSGSWTGDLIAYPINTSTGVPDVSAPIWATGCTSPTAYVDPTDTSKGVLGCSAQVQLDLKNSATRKIFTSNDTSTCTYNCGIPFQPTTASGSSGTDKISSAQKAFLNTPSLTDGDAVVDYLRGDKSGENTSTYRSRAHLFGDTVDSEPSVVREPNRNYLDVGYSAFKTANPSRARIILQAANDGMVHAFNSLTGAEEWAYVPNLLISNMRDPSNASTSILNTRSRKVNFNHYFMLDGTPVVGDLDFNNAGTTGNVTTNWGTIAVGGLGRGARGYYALNVTTTTATTEAVAATKALWEFPRSVTNATSRASAFLNVGNTTGKPIIVKTAAAGWVVLVTSGYNNGTNTGDSGGDGLGHLYVLNAKTGDLIADLPTTGCHATPTTNPCGLANINGYVENREIDNTAEIVYGGDLYGNVYRFDLRATTVAAWSVSKLATLRSGPGVADPVQPITTVPELSKIVISGTSRYFVYVGTGLYLGKTDLPCPPSPASCSWTPNSQSTQTQTMYGLVDPRDGTTLANPLRPNLVAQTYTTSGNTRTITNNTVDFTTKKGWYIDVTGGERLVTDAALASGALVFTSNVPNTTVCVPGGSSWLYAVDYQTGGKISITETTGSGSGTTTTTTNYGGTYLGNALASRPVLIQLPDGSQQAIVRLSDTTTVTKPIPPSNTSSVARRVSWRELIDK